LPAEDLPEWLKAAESEIQEETHNESTLEAPPIPSLEETLPAEDLPDWLKATESKISEETDIEAELETQLVSSQEETLPAEHLPEWLKAAESEVLEETGTEPGLAQPPTEETSVPPSISENKDEDIESALAWLETLAAQHGAEQETLSLAPEKRLSEPPAWMRQEQEKTKIQEKQEEILAEEGGIETRDEHLEIVTDETTIPALGHMQENKEISDILAEIQQEAETTEIPTKQEKVETACEEVVQVFDEEESAVPELIKLDENEKTIVESIGEGSTSQVVDLGEARQEVAFEEPLEATLAFIPEIPEENQDELQVITECLSKGKHTEALEKYHDLILANKNIGKIILHLQDALYQYPVDSSLWQFLGDAYIKDNKIQDALDAYSKAEELLK